MISPRKNSWSLVPVLALLGSAAWAAEPNVPIHLEFEISPTSLGPYAQPRKDSVLYSLASRRPACAVAIPLVGPLEWLPSPSRRTMAGFLGRRDTRRGTWVEGYVEERGSVSEQQKAFLQAAESVLNYPTSNFVQNRPDPNAPERVLLFAVTLEDAKKMAQAYYTYARNDWWGGHVSDLNDKALPGWTQRVAQEEARAAELEQALTTAQKALADLVKTVPYRTETEAHEAIGELDRMLNAAEVEIAGIKAKMQAVMYHQREGRIQQRQEILAKLDMMYIDEAIVLQGTEARKQMATRLREQANRYLDLKSTLTSAAAEQKTLGENLPRDRRQLAGCRQDLEDALRQEPKIPAKVVIYPVQWANEPSQN